MTDIEEKSARLLKLPEVLARLQISKSTFWKGIKEGRFPKPVYVTDRSPRWRLGDIIRLTETGGQPRANGPAWVLRRK